MKTGRSLQDLAAEIERQNETKKDYIASTRLMRVVPLVAWLAPSDRAEGQGYVPDQQYCSRSDCCAYQHPAQVLRQMRTEAPGLLATNIERWFREESYQAHGAHAGRRCTRVLSDKFSPLDNHDFAEAALPMLVERQAQGYVLRDHGEAALHSKQWMRSCLRDVPVGHKMGDGCAQDL